MKGGALPIFNTGEVAAGLHHAAATRLLLHPELCGRLRSLLARRESLLVDVLELHPHWWMFLSRIPVGEHFGACVLCSTMGMQAARGRTLLQAPQGIQAPVALVLLSF